MWWWANLSAALAAWADRIYVFRTTQYANIMNRTLEVGDVARNKLTMPDSYLAEDLAERLIELRGLVLGYSEHDAAAGSMDVSPTEAPAATPDRRVPGRPSAAAHCGSDAHFAGALTRRRALHRGTTGRRAAVARRARLHPTLCA